MIHARIFLNAEIACVNEFKSQAIVSFKKSCIENVLFNS